VCFYARYTLCELPVDYKPLTRWMHSVEIKSGSSHQFPVMCILLGIDCVKCVQTCWWFFVKGWGVKKVVPERHLMVRFQIL
jgi:hypothetical protein